MEIVYRVLLSLVKALIRIPLDVILFIPIKIRSMVAPNLRDFIFLSNTDLLRAFTLNPGDVVTTIEHYDYLTGTRQVKDSSEIPLGGFTVGSVIGYNLLTGKVIVSYFNTAEVSRPTIKSVYEKDVKVLRSPLEEILLQIYTASLTVPIEQFNEIESENYEDILGNVPDDDGEDSGGGIVH